MSEQRTNPLHPLLSHSRKAARWESSHNTHTPIPCGPQAIDVWATGITLYTMLTGRTPFWAETVPEIYERIQVRGHVCVRTFRPAAAWLPASHEACAVLWCLLCALDTHTKLLLYAAPRPPPPTPPLASPAGVCRRTR